jgi:two-component system chemotaxis response regulator CheB
VDHWQCRVGHRYSPETLADAQAEDVEAALWTAVRALHDRGGLLHRMAERADARNRRHSARSLRRRAERADMQAGLVRGTLMPAAESALHKVGDTGGEDAEADDVV